MPDEPDRWLFGVPREFEDPGPGFGRIEVEGSDRLVHISDRGDERLYLVFDEAGASDLAFFFALLPLSIVLLLMYLLLFVAFVGRTGRCRPSCASPVSCRRRLRGQRSRRARAWRLASPHQRRGRDALDQLAARINAAIDHERLFTRDAGHELRTPVAVFNGSLDLLETAPESRWHERDQQALKRMRRTVEDTETLLEKPLACARRGGGASQGRDLGERGRRRAGR